MSNASQFLHLHPEAYSVGWITTLTVEFAAARRMLDQRHERPEIGRNNGAYEAGQINGHYVVIACSAGQGPVHAGHTATRMMNSFPNIRVHLLSGIGGGVSDPPKKDVRVSVLSPILSYRSY